MKLLDVNLLIYALDTTSTHHLTAREWVEATLSGTETVALTWVTMLAFLRLSTRSVVFANPISPDVALDIIDGWLAQPTVTVVHPTDRHTSVLRELLGPLGTGGNLTTDAHLAALAIEHGAELCSSDSDFSRFAGLRWFNPLSV